MTRKKSRQNLDAMLYAQCPCCEGRGRVQSPATVAITIRRQLRRLSMNRTGSFVVQAHPQVAELLSVPAELKKLQQELALAVKIEAVPTLHPEAHTILAGPE
jgi:ribonuclease G